METDNRILKLQIKLNDCYTKIVNTPKGSKLRHNLQNMIYKTKKTLEELEKNPNNQYQLEEARKIAKKYSKDSMIQKEVWLTTTHKADNHIEPMETVSYKCSECGKESNERYAINALDLEQGFICKECNEKHYDGKCIKFT